MTHVMNRLYLLPLRHLWNRIQAAGIALPFYRSLQGKDPGPLRLILLILPLFCAREQQNAQVVRKELADAFQVIYLFLWLFHHRDHISICKIQRFPSGGPIEIDII